MLKPVRADRLLQTVTRLQNTLQQRPQHTDISDPMQDAVLAQLRTLLNLRTDTHRPQHLEPALPPLQLLQASVGKALRMVPVADVLRLEAADKYVRVFTLGGSEVLLRTPLKELMQRLDAQVFWQIHRGSVVRASAIDSVTRDEMGRLSLRLKDHAETLAVSRLYAHLFKAM